MSHGKKINPYGAWVASSVPETSDYRGFDAAQARMINGDDGGSWGPLSVIGIGGSGLVLASAGSIISGGVSTARTGRLVLGASDFNTLGPARTRSVIVPLEWMQQQPSLSGRATDVACKHSTSAFLRGLVAQSFSTAIKLIVPPRFIHGGANFVSAKLSFHSSPSGSQGVLFSLSSALPDGTSPQTFTPNSATTWAASHAYGASAYVKPTSANQTGFYYKSSGAASSGSAEPAWPIIIGNTVTDGGVTWTCVGQNGTMTANAIAILPSLANVSQSVIYAQDPATALTVDPTTLVYQVSISADASSILHSLTLNFGNITSNAFE